MRPTQKQPEHLAKTDLFAILDTLGICYNSVKHEPIFTVLDSKTHREPNSAGAYTKNLFLQDRKGKMWLVTCEEDRVLNLKQVSVFLNTSRLSFVSTEMLKRCLGVRSGAVSPLSLINDNTNAISLVFGKELLSHGHIHFHPMDNSYTVSMTMISLMKFLEYIEHQPIYLPLNLDD